MSNYDEEKSIIDALKDKENGSQSMRVVGRGTLVMDARDVRSSQKYKDLLERADEFISQKAETNIMSNRKWWMIWENNSGAWHCNPSDAMYVCILADSADTAYSILSKMDWFTENYCDCCGPRWGSFELLNDDEPFDWGTVHCIKDDQEYTVESTLELVDECEE